MKIDLDGLWYFAIDQDPQYHLAEDYSRDLSLRHWESVQVPGCWNKYSDKYDLYEGVAWYVKELDLLDLPDDLVALLRFEGVNYIADVYMNGNHVGSHEGGYTAFVLDVSKHIRSGKNRIAVRVDNRHLKIRLPAVLGWYNYGGIHRSVTLNLTSESQITGVKVEFDNQAQPYATGKIIINRTGCRSDYLMSIAIYDPDGHRMWGREYLTTDEPIDFNIFNPQSWDCQNPNLYTLYIKEYVEDDLVDQFACKFGIRSIETSGNEILFNGNPFHLNGVCYLYDHPATGVAFDYDVIDKDLDDLQELGVNCLRSHFPVPDMFLDECDRRGMTLWLEVPVYCIAPSSEDSDSVFAESGVVKLARQMLREMVEQVGNHPSVILYSVGNECNTDHPESLAFFESCVELVRELDNTRLISYAALYGGVGCVADLVDVIGINEYWGWYDRIAYDGSIESAPQLPIEIPELDDCLTEQSKINKPLLLTEFGADSLPGYKSASMEYWSENYHAELLRVQFETASRYPAVCGTFPFLYTDYRDPSKPINAFWHGINYKGVVDYHRNRKLPWDAVKKAYSPEQE